ncbi:hypothetical protein L484_009524 [Morus notabilis]|uniref:Uncharacterized protein n=1 Tax=Morus notabilis TaxID=981085 RepID=W9RSL7_9ROSA|nr:hypothetical protein L484_009524 [Morus notabilis]
MVCLMGSRRTGFTTICLHFAEEREDTMRSSCRRSNFAEIWLAWVRKGLRGIATEIWAFAAKVGCDGFAWLVARNGGFHQRRKGGIG